MRDDIRERLRQLKAEYDSGHKMLANLDTQRRSLEETLLRISGAIQVLEEILGETPARGVSVSADEEESNGNDAL